MTWLAQRLPLLHALATTHRTATLCAIVLGFLTLQWGYYGLVIAQSEGWVTQFGPIVGGDFIVFYEAANSAVADAPFLYDFDAFNARLEERFQPDREFALSWAYPPTMLVLLQPLSWAPYPVAYALWTGLTMALFLWVCHRLWAHGRAMLFVVASPAVFQTVITGQTGFLTGALFALAGYAPRRNPILSGVAAGLLTVKPQLGILLPIAYAACGAWRAFSVAALTALGLAAFSLALFGGDAWAGFIAEFTQQGERLVGAVLPYYKFTSVYGGLMTTGAPGPLAMAVQGIASLLLIGLIVYVWRRSDDDATRYSVLAAAALLASPYAYYYELTLVVPAVLLVARRAAAAGWLTGEGLAIAALWMAPMMMPGDKPPTLPIVFLGAFTVFAVVMRRAAYSMDITFASAARSAPQGS